MAYKLVMVCMGNICRSPTAHGVLRQRLAQAHLSGVVHVDSAGTHNDHPGAPPDPRSLAHAQRRGYDLSDLRARQITPQDFEEADLLLAMDWDNWALLQAQCPPQHQRKVRRFAEFFKTASATAVLDPYHGGDQGFDEVLDLIEDGADGLLSYLSTPAVLARCIRIGRMTRLASACARSLSGMTSRLPWPSSRGWPNWPSSTTTTLKFGMSITVCD